jgi:two-component system cell cycle sensor histidine kinase/response regulator CckA
LAGRKSGSSGRSLREVSDLSKKNLHIFIVEDDPVDVELAVFALQREGYAVTYDVADDAETFQQKFREGEYDIILADHKLPNWTGIDALRLQQQLCPEVPFIVVTASLGDEAAVDYIKQGASDYVLKSGLERLPLAVERALREKSYRQERTLLEEQLRQAQKMEAVGRLAGGIAHDFNNLLTVILGRCELLMQLLQEGSMHRSYTEEIQTAITQAASLIQQLLAFSRKQAIQYEPVDLNEVVKNTQGMLERLIPENIQLSTVLTTELGLIRANRTQIEQVMLNLVVNARDAMPMGGTLTIETEPFELSESTPNPQLDLGPGEYVLLTVRDTGTGMDAETLSHIFEPFYTTKQKGKGTGLGLPTVYGIVKQSGGSINVQSKPNSGTTFRIYLPRTEDVPKRVAAPKGELQRGSETILVVEDNRTVRQLTVEMLMTRGYRVLSADSGEEAMRLCKNCEGGVDLLLTDVIMPQESGPSLAERVTRMKPDIKVLYMSGYAQEMINQQGLLDGTVALLTKPFTMHELSVKVREVLDSKPLPLGEAGAPQRAG